MPGLSSRSCPQIVAIAPLASDGSCVLRKTVRQHLGAKPGDFLALSLGDEILVSTFAAGAQDAMALSLDRRGKVTLPDKALVPLGSPPPERVALIERPNAVALKSISVETVDSDHARFLDVETPLAVVRRVEANPMPETAIPDFALGAQELRLPYDVVGYLQGRPTLHAWAARRVLDCPGPGDDALRERLVQERVAAQADDGAWGEGPYRLVLTARALRELADLGLGQEADPIQRGVAWLLARPQSEHNPGQWFLSDDLVEQQARVIAERRAMTRGTRPRFRALRAAETKGVMAGNDLVRAPCGPRIMWPSGLVLDALLALGYESAPRVQAALGLLITQDWCECGYQHGTSDDRPDRKAYADDRLAAYEAAAVRSYRYGRLDDPDDLYQRDLSHQPVRFLRVRGERRGDTEVFILQPDLHIQGCEFITTRAMAAVSDPDMRRFSEAHLWRFAGCQLADGTFPREKHGTGFGQVGILELFARYSHHPVAQVVLLRALPWLVAAQNADGSWDQPEGPEGRSEARAEAATRTVVTALKAIEAHLPTGFWGV